MKRVWKDRKGRESWTHKCLTVFNIPDWGRKGKKSMSCVPSVNCTGFWICKVNCWHFFNVSLVHFNWAKTVKIIYTFFNGFSPASTWLPPSKVNCIFKSHSCLLFKVRWQEVNPDQGCNWCMIHKTLPLLSRVHWSPFLSSKGRQSTQQMSPNGANQLARTRNLVKFALRVWAKQTYAATLLLFTSCNWAIKR